MRVRASAPAAARRPLLCPRATLSCCGRDPGMAPLKFGFLKTSGQVYCFLCTLARSITRGDVVVPVVRLDLMPASPVCLSHLPLPFVYEPVSWLKKAQTSCVDLFSIGSKQKCIAFCKYASYLPAKLEAGACSPLSASATVVGRQSLQQRDRRSEPRSSSAPKSRLQLRPRLAPPSNSPSAAPSVRSAR